MSKEYHVAKTGSDSWCGSLTHPFLTIQRAADLAAPGDTVVIHEGVYREYVDPKNGGTGEDKRITYRAADGESAAISGAEVAGDWLDLGNGIYSTRISNEIFGDFNPYRERIWGDWFDTIDRVCHLGEIYIDGRSLFEAGSYEEMAEGLPYPKAREQEWSAYKWFAKVEEQETVIYANFHELIPSEHTVEYNVRKFCFWPSQNYINYITVRGLKITMGAPNWAPPTALQEGMIGPHWSRGWIIEQNEISHSKCSGISLGKEISSGHNLWSLEGRKNGTQHERDIIMNALHHCNWNREHVGSHIVRGNIIHDCEQTGICGHLGAVFSRICGNHIYNIHQKRLFNGAEVAGIKLHAAIDTLIMDNHVHNCDRGFWMDWQAQGTRITGNLMYDNDTEDIFVEVSHGPYLVDNNLLLSMKNFRNLSQGGAFVHNLFAGFLTLERVSNRFTPYHYPHETGVHGFMTILNGDDRFYNNIFLGTQDRFLKKEQDIDTSFWMNRDVALHKDRPVEKGLSIYDEHPGPHEDFYSFRSTVDDFAAMRLPVYAGSNLYFHDAKPFCKEENSAVAKDASPQYELLRAGDGSIALTIDLTGAAERVAPQIISTETLGTAFETEARYENPDGTPLTVGEDFYGSPICGAVCAGPVQTDLSVRQTLTVTDPEGFLIKHHRWEL